MSGDDIGSISFAADDRPVGFGEPFDGAVFISDRFFARRNAFDKSIRPIGCSDALRLRARARFWYTNLSTRWYTGLFGVAANPLISQKKSRTRRCGSSLGRTNFAWANHLKLLNINRLAFDLYPKLYPKLYPVPLRSLASLGAIFILNLAICSQRVEWKETVPIRHCITVSIR